MRNKIITRYASSVLSGRHAQFLFSAAKYNSAGQLTCILCASVVKNELVWPAHVNGKVHKDNVANLKNGKQPAVVPNGLGAQKRYVR